MTIFGSAVGIYFGQDWTKPTDNMEQMSQVDKCKINKIQFSHCGTGILLLAARGNHYSIFDDLHFINCQIDVNLRASNFLV